MAIPNVNQITATLRMMGDQQLQKYAAMHKNDPYILPMAIAESNTRKQMRAQGQAQGAGQPQPKVADASIAAMAAPAVDPMGNVTGFAAGGLPEDRGIARLRTPNIQNMADGGIAGYADGGYTDQDMVDETSPVTYMAEGGIARFAGPADQLVRTTSGGKDWFLDVPDTIQDPNVPWYKLIPSPTAALANKKFATKEEALAAYDKLNMLALPEHKPASQMGYDAPAAVSPAAKTGANTTGAGPNLTGATGAPTGPAPIPRVNAAAMPSLPGGLSDLSKLRQEIYNKQDFKDPAAKEVGALGEEMIAGAERRKKEFDDYEKAQGDVFKGREGRISAREEELGKNKETNTGLAFLNAGLAIMSTPGGLATAIGKGAQVGTAQFAAGLDKIRAAQERLEEAKDKTEELRINRSDMSFKQRSALSAEIDKAKTDAKKMSVDGLRMAADVNQRTATNVLDKTVDLAKTQYEQAGATARSNAQLQATLGDPSRMAFMAALQSTVTKDKPQGDPVAAYQKLTEMKREPMTEKELRAEWLDQAKRMQIAQDYPNVKTFEDYKAIMAPSMGGGGGGDFRVVGVRDKK